MNARKHGLPRLDDRSQASARSHAGDAVPGKRTLTEALPYTGHDDAPRGAGYEPDALAAPGDDAPAAPGDDALAAPGDDALDDQLGSFEQIIASAPGGAVPGDVGGRFESAHAVDLAAVRVHVVGSLARHGVRGLSRGRQIALADTADREALEHELGHVVDAIGAGGAPPNTALDGMPLADDPAREARADELAAQAGGELTRPARPGPRREPSAAPTGAPQPKLTRRTAIGKNAGNFAWSAHKTKVTAQLGGGFTAEGLGAVLSSTTSLNHTWAANHGQLDTLKATVPPHYVDATRPQLPEPALHPGKHQGAYVVPSTLLGAAIDANRLYLPPAALAELSQFQTQMLTFAKGAPVAIEAKTTFGVDGLANQVFLKCQALDRVTGTAVATITWDTQIEADRTKWGTAAVQNLGTVGVAPMSAEWKTEVTWDAPHASGDGVRVVADKLGPDHPLGSTPSDKTAADRVAKLEEKSTPPPKNGKAGKPEPYIAGHLLNDHLGGPGNLSANLAPIPKTANSQMSTNIELPAKDIVNKERGWIRYEVRVTESHDATAGLHYPSRIEAEMEVYDKNGLKQNKTTSNIDIDSPTTYAKAQATAPKASHKLAGQALESSPMMLDEVVLSHENDLRPNLRDSAELFQLIVGSELNPNVGKPALSQAWAKILEQLRAFEVAALADLNLLSTVSTAMETWRNDPVAKKFLEDTTVGKVKLALATSHTHATTFVQKATDQLQQANVAVRKELAPSDLFRNADLLRFAKEVVQDAPDPVSMLLLLESRQASSVPHWEHTRKKAKLSGDLASEQKHGTLVASYGAQSHAAAPPFPLSPVHTFEQTNVSAHDLTLLALYGADFESERAPKAAKCLCKYGEAKEGAKVSALLTDPVLSTSERCRTLLKQLLQALDTEQAHPGALDLVEFWKLHEGTWKDSIEVLGCREPGVAKRLYELLPL
jgi:hypothetical protein